jgi:hypothetical protein
LCYTGGTPLTRNEFESFLLYLAALAVLLSAISLIRYGAKGRVALYQAGGFGAMAVGLLLLRSDSPVLLIGVAFIAVVGFMAADVAARKGRS